MSFSPHLEFGAKISFKILIDCMIFHLQTKGLIYPVHGLLVRRKTAFRIGQLLLQLKFFFSSYCSWLFSSSCFFEQAIDALLGVFLFPIANAIAIRFGFNNELFSRGSATENRQ